MTKTGRKMTWATVTLALLLIAAAALLQGCKADPAASLSKMGIPHTKEGFADAISVGNTKAVDCFLALGTDPNVRLADGMTPLGLAAKGGYLEIAQALLAQNADPNITFGTEKRTALGWAAFGGHGSLVQELLKHQADARTTTSDGTTALHLAAQSGDSTAISALISAGADVNAKNRDGAVPLHLAVSQGSGEGVKLLIQAGAKKDITYFDDDIQGPVSALFCAAKLGKADVVAALIECGFSPNERLDTWSGDTPLMIASALGHLETVQALVQGGADANMVGTEGSGSPLTAAIYGGHVQVVDYLISQKADLTVTVNYGESCPLCLAAACGHDQIIEALLNAGLDVNHPIRSGEFEEKCIWTPLMWAAQAGSKNTVSLLLSKGADPKTKSHGGDTAADLAAQAGYDDIWNMLK